MIKSDYFLLSIVICLVLLGILILMSVSAAIAQQKFGSPTFYLFRHFIFGLIPGAVLGFLAYKIPLARFKKWIPRCLLFNLFLMVLVFAPIIGLTLGGASSWLNLRFTSLQPSEFLKLVFILYLALWLSARTEKNKGELSQTFYAFLAIIVIISILLIKQPDVGTLGILISTALLMFFLANTPIKHSLIALSAILAGLIVLIKIAPYRLERFLAFIKPGSDPMNAGYQIKQALIAIGSGGIFGTGLGIGVQKFGFLPQPMADSIFACFTEETGLVGGLTLIFLFSMLAWLGFSIAKKTKNNFEKLTALGITSWLSLQAFVNIGSMAGLLPLTGVPLPFIGYGGSAMIAELTGIGILLNISKHT